MPCFCNFFSSMLSPTIAQVPDSQWNSLLVSAVSFMFFFLACGSLNYFVFSLLLIFFKDSDLQPVFRRYSWCYSSLTIFSWLSMLISKISVLTVFTSLDSTIEFSELLVLRVDWLSLAPWVTSKSHVPPTILQLLF